MLTDAEIIQTYQDNVSSPEIQRTIVATYQSVTGLNPHQTPTHSLHQSHKSPWPHNLVYPPLPQYLEFVQH